MADMACHGCDELIDDEQLLCPHCGAATIPQQSKTEIQKRADRDHERKHYWTGWFTGVGFLIGGGLAAVAIILRPDGFAPESLVSLVGCALGAALLAGLFGVVFDIAVARSRRR